MAMSTNLISGLSSGFDWRSMIDQLMELEHRPVDLVENQKTKYEAQLSEWQSFNTQLLSLKTAAGNLKDPTDFYVYTSNMTTDSSTVDAWDLLSVSTTSTAAKGTYSVKITSVATAQKLSSASFSDYDEALGGSYAGDILINGVSINTTATDDLAAVRDKINNANAGTDPTGVTASIISYGTTASVFRMDLPLIWSNFSAGKTLVKALKTVLPEGGRVMYLLVPHKISRHCSAFQPPSQGLLLLTVPGWP